MDEFSLKFRRWMDGHQMKAADVADALFVTEQSVRNWRSAGIPPRRQPQVADWMAGVDAAAQGPSFNPLRTRPFVVEADPGEFHTWEIAALREGKTLTEWARSGLTEMARRRGFGGTSDSAEPPRTGDDAVAGEPPRDGGGSRQRRHGRRSD
jgi:hypothetical protein